MDDVGPPKLAELSWDEFLTLSQGDDNRVKRIIGMNDDGSTVVELLDGRVAKIIPPPAPAGPPRSSVSHLKRIIERPGFGAGYPARVKRLFVRLVSDERMNEFWTWLEGVKYKRSRLEPNSYSIAQAIERFTRLPSKPGNLTPSQREAYFAKVRQHARVLEELLADTRFDHDTERELTDFDYEQPLQKVLWDWGEDEPEEGHIKAYRVTTDGAFEQHYNYPDNDLTNILRRVVEWTHWEDQWDGNIFKSSLPIAQTNSQSSLTVYFNCSLFTYFHNYGVEIPFPILATVANVALDLSVENQVDEDTARKQVRRFQARSKRSQGELAFGEDGAGHNSGDWEDSVLSDPF